MKKSFFLLVVILFFLIESIHAFSWQDGFKYALENDIDSKVNENNLKNIKLDQDIAEALLYPKVDFSAKVERTKTTKNKSSANSSYLKSDEYKFKVTQPIFDGFESKNEKELQEYRFKSAIYYLKESQGKVAIDYSTAYVNTLRQRDLLNLNIESLNISEDIFDKVYKKTKMGYGTKLEFEKAKGNVVENRVKLNVQRINFKESLENLRYYVQTDFDSSELIKPNLFFNFPKNLNEAIALSLENNPSINVSKINVDVSVAEKKKIDKNFYPDVNFVASYNINDAIYTQNDESNRYKLGVELSYNLYNGGMDSLKAKKALQKVKEKKLLIKKTEYQIKNKIRLAWHSYKLDKEKEKSLKQFLLVKEDILDATLKEFDLGLKTLESLYDAHIDYIDAKKDLISNSYDLLLSQYKILDATGSLVDALQNKLPKLKKIDTNSVEKELFTDSKYSFNNKIFDGKDKIKILKTKPSVKNISLFDTKVPFSEDKNIQKVSLNIMKDNSLIQKFEPKREFSDFKDKFLSASKDKYTINLAISDSEIKAQNLINKYKLNSNAFFFSFRKVRPLQKILLGVYDSKKDARQALISLPYKLKKNGPIVERITIKQNLFYKYHGNKSNLKSSRSI